MKRASTVCVTLLVLLFLQSCSKDMPPLPDVPELDTSALSQLYGMDSSNDAIVKTEVLTFVSGDDEIHYRFLSPSQKGEYPLLVFSHGNWSDQLSYDLLLSHWVSRGYVILTLDHDDCCGMASGIFAALKYGNAALINNRVSDIIILLNSLEEISSGLPDGVIASDQRITITGHSFGAFTAQMFAGATILDEDSQHQVSYSFNGFDLSRITAVLAISPPGPMFDEITANSWSLIDKPMLITTGTWDVEPNFFPRYQLHQMSYDNAPQGDKYSLLIQGADHYFGNLICRPEREVSPQQHQFEMLLSSSSAFLDAYVKQDETAKAFLASNQIGEITQGFAHIESK